MRFRMGGIAALLAFAAVPASANAASSIVIPDGCGDASQNVVAVNGTGVPVSSGRAPTYDIDSATLSAVLGGGLEAQVKTCGPIPAAADPIGGTWQVAAGAADGCSVSFFVSDFVDGGRQGGMDVWCPYVTQTPLGPGYGSQEVFKRVLRADEWSVAGDTVSFHISAPALKVAHVGSVLTDPSAHSWDGARVTETYNNTFAVNGPGIADHARSTGALNLG